MEAGNALKSVLDAMEDAAKKSLAYGRVADFLSVLEVALFISAALAGIAYVLSYAYWQLAAAGAALAVAAFAVDKLSGRYYRKALKELDRLEMLALVMVLSVGPAGRAKELLRQKVEELKSGLASSN